LSLFFCPTKWCKDLASPPEELSSVPNLPPFLFLFLSFTLSLLCTYLFCVCKSPFERHSLPLQIYCLLCMCTCFRSLYDREFQWEHWAIGDSEELERSLDPSGCRAANLAAVQEPGEGHNLHESLDKGSPTYRQMPTSVSMKMHRRPKTVTMASSAVETSRPLRGCRSHLPTTKKHRQDRFSKRHSTNLIMVGIFPLQLLDIH